MLYLLDQEKKRLDIVLDFFKKQREILTTDRE